MYCVQRNGAFCDGSFWYISGYFFAWLIFHRNPFLLTACPIFDQNIVLFFCEKHFKRLSWGQIAPSQMCKWNMFLIKIHMLKNIDLFSELSIWLLWFVGIKCGYFHKIGNTLQKFRKNKIWNIVQEIHFRNQLTKGMYCFHKEVSIITHTLKVKS